VASAGGAGDDLVGAAPSNGPARRDRLRRPRDGRHRAPLIGGRFSASFEALGEVAYSGASVSASVLDVGSGETLLSIDDRITLPTASVGKVLLLIELSAQITAGRMPDLTLLDRTPALTVGDSGLWQHLQVPSLPVADLAVLVAATSDNLATNVLLDRVGLDAVRERADSLGLSRTALLDLVRDARGPDDAPQLSLGSTAELSWLFAALSNGEIVDPVTSSRVIGWLGLNMDLSMVASAFGLDPLAHRFADHGLSLVNKTGTDAGLRSEAGLLRGPRGAVAYAVTVRFTDGGLPTRLRVLEAMRTVGSELLEHVH
jgi:beta-lactamase class A